VIEVLTKEGQYLYLHPSTGSEELRRIEMVLRMECGWRGREDEHREKYEFHENSLDSFISMAWMLPPK
jgi:hypothetical protein